MTAMLVPQVAMVREVGWRQVMGLAQGNDAFWQHVRGQQLSLLQRNAPFNLSMLVANLWFVLGSFEGAVPLAAVLPWVAGCVALAGWWGVQSLLGRRGKAADAKASQPRYWAVAGEFALLALCWAGLAAELMPALGADAQGVLVLEGMIFMVAASLTAITLPAATLAVTAIVGAGLLWSIPVGAPLDRPMIVIAVVTVIAMMLRSSLIATQILMARLKRETEFREQQEVVRLLLNEYESNASDWLLELDARGCLTHVTQRLADVARRRREELLGQPFLALIDPIEGGGAAMALDEAISQRQPFRDLVVPVAIGRDVRWWALSGTPKQDAQGRFTGFRGVGRDVTEVRRSQERIAQLARFDPLTGLANRSLFRETLEQVVERAVMAREPAVLLFVDLDRFKAVNDCFGHAAGDLLLRLVAQRLQRLVKAGTTIARLGGDEFAILLDSSGADEAAGLAGAIVAAMAQPFPMGDVCHGGATVIGASVGWAVAPDDAETPEDVLKCADLALYQVKEAGRGAALRFAPEMAEAVAERRRLEADLADALPRGELALAFQPVVDASDERICGFEALLRWNHPQLGAIPPLRFVPVAEETGLIVPIGRWVIDEALGSAARWPAHMQVAVNLSAAQVEDLSLPAYIAARLAHHGVAPERLELEITESLFLADKPAVKDVLSRLTGMGVNFALDDFGTGYSALGTLQKATFNRIKIDRSFVRRAAERGDESTAIIQAIVRLAASLNMRTTAEGTESRAAAELCRQLGCTQMQGYLFGKPMTPEEATALALAGVLVQPA
jgi:diguanylate cyclase (GGDEF)-like protein